MMIILFPKEGSINYFKWTSCYNFAFCYSFFYFHICFSSIQINVFIVFFIKCKISQKITIIIFFTSPKVKKFNNIDNKIKNFLFIILSSLFLHLLAIYISLHKILDYPLFYLYFFKLIFIFIISTCTFSFIIFNIKKIVNSFILIMPTNFFNSCFFIRIFN